MEHSLMVTARSKEAGKMIAVSAGKKERKYWSLSKNDIGKTFSVNRIRVNTVYVLLIAAIFFTLLSAIATCIEIKAIEKNILSPKEFSPLRFSAFVLLSITCSLALITIIRKDKRNSRLLTKLRSANMDLNHAVEKRTTELAQAINAKDHFLAIATHDLKSPLNGILGLVELVRIENKDRSANESEYLAHIEYSCKKMHGLIHDILEINRIEQGAMLLKRQPVDLLPLLRKIEFDFAHQAAKKNIDLVFRRDIDAIVETDPDSLIRILENLVSNAIKFSPANTEVSLRVTSDKRCVTFEVSDQGPGITPEEQPKLFNKFQKLSNRPTNSEISTGLGLSIVKELTLQLGGEVGFRTEVGKGSTFIVMLPFAAHSGKAKELHQ